MTRKTLTLLMTFIGIILIVVLLAGCGGSGGSATDKFKNAVGGGDGDWTVLVYLNADNDLEPYGILNFNQMEQVGSSDRLKIVVQMDRSPNYDRTNDNWTGCRRYLVQKDSDPEIIHSTLLQDMGEVDMGNPDTLRDFITWGQQNYPASHYLLVIWNHGSGWRSAQTQAITTIPRNISFDDTSGTSIKTTDIPYALAAASPQMDVVAMDASLMQMLEVAYEVRNSTSLLVGSEESPPGEGYPYDRWLSKLAASPGMSPAELGATIAQEYVNYYADPAHEYPVTESVVDLSQVAGVAQAADDLAVAVLPHAAADSAVLRTARQSAQAYAFDYYKDLIDYGGLLSQMLQDPKVASAFSKLQSSLSSAVIFEKHTGNEVSRSHGLSIYMPAPVEYVDRYETLSFTKDYPNWAKLIKAQTE